MTVGSDLKALANPAKARILSGFFKTGRGEYGEGDVFLGIVVPETRRVAGKYANLPLGEVRRLLSSRIHEERLAGLLILVDKYRKARDNDRERKRIFDFYLANTYGVNNWDLVDLSTPEIVSDYLLDHEKERAVLYKLARSRNVWERRIAIMGTFRFIKARQFCDALKIAEMLLKDEHDLIHKAVGWMLREIGKQDQDAEERFLKKHCRSMPRTMLRYSIEKFDARKRASYMKKISRFAFSRREN
jgi:3-methyladenine DNA glycosylase AlkD